MLPLHEHCSRTDQLVYITPTSTPPLWLFAPITPNSLLVHFYFTLLLGEKCVQLGVQVLLDVWLTVGYVQDGGKEVRCQVCLLKHQ